MIGIKSSKANKIQKYSDSYYSAKPQSVKQFWWSNVKLKSRNYQDKIESSKIGATKKSSSKKREQEQVKVPRSKKLKYLGSNGAGSNQPLYKRSRSYLGSPLSQRSSKLWWS